MRISLLILLSAIAAVSTARASEGPRMVPLSEWVAGPALPSAQEGTRVCASHGYGGEWKVTSGGGNVRVQPFVVGAEKDQKRLPFRMPRAIARSHEQLSSVLQVWDGYLVARDQGEWGGGLWWVAKDGKSYYTILKTNVFAVLRLGEAFLAVTGRAHLGSDTGAIHELQRDPKTKKWIGARALDLGAAPQAIATRDEALSVVTNKAIERYQAGALRSLLAVDLSSLYPSSIAEDKDGTLYVGMRYLVLKMQRPGSNAKITWLRPPDCVTLHEEGDECRCSASTGGTKP